MINSVHNYLCCTNIPIYEGVLYRIRVGYRYTSDTASIFVGYDNDVAIGEPELEAMIFIEDDIDVQRQNTEEANPIIPSIE
ncbi:hypothetical protein M5K25_001916 [Dendrobium thyrsiflorum]|uniref:Uncharacterized protein n=1 Tax=Dendrobium thyrsiflorum TaxID=117978 RepID=A0ABD0VRL0_DENTH